MTDNAKAAAIPIGSTQRGFGLGQFVDLYGNVCSIQESSLADQYAIWLGVDDANPVILASQAAMYGIRTKETTGWVPYPIPEAVSLYTRMHLTQEQAAMLIPLLQHFVEHGTLPNEDKE